MDDQYGETLLNDVLDNIHHSKELTYDQIRVLHCLLGNLVVEALHLLDTGSVVRLDCGTLAKRQVYQIQDTLDGPKAKRDNQLCYLLPRHCSCGVFLRSVVCDQSMLLCRHILAALLFEALKDQQRITILDEEAFAKVLYTWNPPMHQKPSC